CLQPEAADFLSQIGYEGLRGETAVIELRYDLPTSAARLSVQAGLAEAADLNLTADFSYFWFRGLETEEPEPAFRLRLAELSIENRGLWDRLEPMVADSIGSTQALPQMLAGALEGELSQNGQRPLGQGERDLVASLSDAAAAFVEQRSRLTVRMVPEAGTWLDEAAFASPEAAIEVLRPVFSTSIHSGVTMLRPGLVSAAMAGAAEVGADERLAAGRALMSGLGAPRDRVAAIRILTPLAEAWNAEAAMALAEGLAAAGDEAAAYPWALRAMAGRAPGAMALGDALEEDLPAKAVLEAQAAVLAGWSADPGLAAHRADLIANPDIDSMRKLAIDLRLGRGLPRNYETAYLWASLAAAAGDRSAAHMRDDLDAKARRRGGAAWREAFDAAAAAALTAWAEEGLGAALAARVSSQ
ncbi:MAG TPA: hypothetical protein VFR34_11700, partial [Paracoccaceae bacterium]|nr:hypothetical protein [Paracoccaceae bacterium]